MNLLFRQTSTRSISPGQRTLIFTSTGFPLRAGIFSPIRRPFVRTSSAILDAVVPKVWRARMAAKIDSRDRSGAYTQAFPQPAAVVGAGDHPDDDSARPGVLNEVAGFR